MNEDLVLLDSHGHPYGSWSEIQRIRERGQHYLDTYRRLGLWTNWPKLHHFVDTGYLMGLVKAQHAEIQRLRDRVKAGEPQERQGEGR